MSEQTQSASEAVAPENKKEGGVIRGTIKYPWGAVQNATVTAGEKSVAADSAGNYEITSLESGSYTVEAHAPFPGYETMVQKVEIVAGETKMMDIYLDFQKAVVEGHVYDINGKPVAGATLSGVFYGQNVQTTATDDQGYFKFDKVTPGANFMRVSARGYMAETRDFTAKKEGATVIKFGLQPAGCRVHGVVTDESGKAVQAEVHLTKDGIVIQKTNSDAATGSYEFPVLPGTYQITIVAPFYEPRGWYGSISADTKLDLRFGPRQRF